MTQILCWTKRLIAMSSPYHLVQGVPSSFSFSFVKLVSMCDYVLQWSTEQRFLSGFTYKFHSRGNVDFIMQPHLLQVKVPNQGHKAAAAVSLRRTHTDSYLSISFLPFCHLAVWFAKISSVDEELRGTSIMTAFVTAKPLLLSTAGNRRKSSRCSFSQGFVSSCLQGD